MPIDSDQALNAAPQVREIAWTVRDVLLYHLSLGAGARADTDPEPAYTYERSLQVLPTFAMVAGQGISSGATASPRLLTLPGIDVDLRQVLHAGQDLVVHRPIPVSGTATLSTKVADVWDKGKAAMVLVETSAADATVGALWTSTMRIWARGHGGFGGRRGPVTEDPVPEREPDHVLDTSSAPHAALLYRLNGDMNPLHADPEFAGAAGFERPILHGLASYGLVARSLVDGVLGGDAARLRALSVRFATPILPGQSLRTRVWRDGADAALLTTCPELDGAPVLSHATARIAPEAP